MSKPTLALAADSTLAKGMAQHDLTTNQFADLIDTDDASVPTATLQIYAFINEYLHRPQDTHVDRASSGALCYRRRWYQRQGHPADKAMGARAQVNFLQGDLAERTMLYFITQGCVGPGKLYSEVDFGETIGAITFQGKELKLYKQQDLVALIDGLPVTAHVDGWGKRNADGQWELIECKSSSDYGFERFKGAEGAGDYIKQAHVCLQTNKAIALGAKSVRYFYLRKQTGHMWDRLFKFDQAIADDVALEYRAARGEPTPQKPYFLREELEGRGAKKVPTGRLIAQFPCTYCPYLERCQGSYDLDFKAGRPVFVFKRKEQV